MLLSRNIGITIQKRVCILPTFFLITASLYANGQTPSESQNTNAETSVLRLEATIRGNKEQPQVLTIVPWQLPMHQRINENKEWLLQNVKLSSIERGAFLRNMALVKEINKERMSPQNKQITTKEKQKELVQP
jgi:hypothetical protein